MAIEFVIETPFNYPGSDCTSMPIQVVGDPKEIINPDEVVIPDQEFSLQLSYPLNGVYTFHCCLNGPMTRLAVFNIISKWYHHIYESPALFGVWGHVIDDLVIEQCTYEDSTLTLYVGS